VSLQPAAHARHLQTRYNTRIAARIGMYPHAGGTRPKMYLSEKFVVSSGLAHSLRGYKGQHHRESGTLA
jgi:hypothetical protein